MHRTHTTISIIKQEKYSRTDALLRAFFGGFILIPSMLSHFFSTIFLSFWSFIEFFSILITGTISQPYVEFYTKYFNQSLHMQAYSFGIIDEIPSMSLNHTSDTCSFAYEYVKEYSRLSLLFKTCIAPIALLGHMFMLVFYSIIAYFVSFIGFFAVLANGTYPDGLFTYLQKYLVWMYQLNAYIVFDTESFPPFTL